MVMLRTSSKSIRRMTCSRLVLGLPNRRGRAFDGDAQPATARFKNFGVLDGRLVTRKADGRVFGSNECFEYMEVGLSARSGGAHHVHFIAGKVVEAHAVEAGELGSLVGGGGALVLFPVGNGLPADPYGCRDFLLAHAGAAAQGEELVRYHGRSFSRGASGRNARFEGGPVVDIIAAPVSEDAPFHLAIRQIGWSWSLTYSASGSRRTRWVQIDRVGAPRRAS